jgi:hypothetical protein
VQSQTLVLASIAAFYPVGLIAVGILLTTEQALRLGIAFLAGAVTSLFVIGIVVITILHGAELNHSSASAARSNLKLGLGIAMLIVGYLILRDPISRRSKRASTDGTGRGEEPSWKRHLRSASPVTVFVTGAVLYSPSATYVGALQQIATSNAGWPPALQLLIVIGIVLITVEVPLLAYAIRPEATGRGVRRAETWVEHHQRQTLAAVFFGVGGYLLIDGLIAIG